MTTVWGRGILMPYYPLLMMAATLFLPVHVHDVGAQECALPSSWRYDWWRENEHGHTARFFRRYGHSFEENLRQAGMGPKSKYSGYDCIEQTSAGRFVYYVKRPINDAIVVDCVKVHQDRLLILTAVASTKKTEYRASDCTTNTDLNDTPLQIMVRLTSNFSFNFDDVCPFRAGSYYVSLTQHPDETKCLNDRHSYANVSTDGKITFQTCVSGDSYETPFQGSVLECVGELDPTIIKSMATAGNLFIVGLKSKETGYYDFYTMRYQIAPNGTVYMSLQGNDYGPLLPDPAKNFQSVGRQDSHFAYSYVLQPTCSSVECKNGGQCKDKDHTLGFMCVCQEGFTGVFCQIDLTMTTVHMDKTTSRSVSTGNKTTANIPGQKTTYGPGQPTTNGPGQTTATQSRQISGTDRFGPSLMSLILVAIVIVA